MKFHVVLLSVFMCLAARTAGTPNQGAPAPNKSAPIAQQSLTGCIDEQDGHYVLLDDQMLKITGLQSSDSDQEVFAKHLGRKVQVTGTKSSGQDGVFRVTGIQRVAGSCGPPK
jgi:hypothetical protein